MKSYDPNRKFSRNELEADYQLLQNILTTKHPALDWYTPRDQINYYFDSLRHEIADSMTELQFGWNVLAPLTEKIHCGHTTFGMSKNWLTYVRKHRIPSFPYFVKVWGDTMLVTGSLLEKNGPINRGTHITAINNKPVTELTRAMFRYMPTDVYNTSMNYIRLSGNFPYFHRNIFGLYKNYRVHYIDSAGTEKSALVPMWMPPDADSISKLQKSKPEKKIPASERRASYLESNRSYRFDSSLQTGIITLNTFSNGEGRHLRHFIKNCFRQLEEDSARNLIIDLRNNGGGDVLLYTLLARYIRISPFKVADSSYAVAHSVKPYTRYIQQGLFTNLGMWLLTRKRADGFYHFGYYERHWYKPKKTHHFNGKVYVLISGPTFSASTLFCHAVKGQENVILVGEEAGGGWHGNSGLMIPDITLPNTRLRVRLPLFKIVQFQHIPKNGLGVMPDIYIPPNSESVLRNEDLKMKTVKELIRNTTLKQPE